MNDVLFTMIKGTQEDMGTKVNALAIAQNRLTDAFAVRNEELLVRATDQVATARTDLHAAMLGHERALSALAAKWPEQKAEIAQRIVHEKEEKARKERLRLLSR
ncbi:hypothetical protein N7454_003290 [Penicillium verhagenii]|nr:hypothetical protein N7454_003290 [Penicillium verhagenii]